MLCGKKLVQAAAPSDPAIVAAIRASPFEPDTRSLRNTYAISPKHCRKVVEIWPVSRKLLIGLFKHRAVGTVLGSRKERLRLSRAGVVARADSLFRITIPLDGGLNVSQR